MTIQLPEETEPEKERITHVKTTEYVVQKQEQQIQTLDEARAGALMEMVDPSNAKTINILKKASRRYSVIEGGLIENVEVPINQYRASNDLVKPIYPEFKLYTKLGDRFDLASNGDGTRAAQVTEILRTPQMGFPMMGGPSNGFENLKSNYEQPIPLGPEYMQSKPPKKHFWSRK